MELIFRQRLDRPDKAGRANIFGDLHWAGGHRWKMPTGVKVLPAHWRPEKAKRIHTAADNANQLNLRLTRLQESVQGVFLKAEAEKRPEASVTVGELQQAVAAAGAGTRRMAVPVAAADDPNAPPTETATWQELYQRWQQENSARLAKGTLVAFRQCVDQLNTFDPTLRVATFTRERLAQYTTYLYEQGKKDSTVGQHYWFLRECFQLTGKAAPKWLGKLSIRNGRALSLLRLEVLALASLEVSGYLAEERDAFLFQLQLLLRDSDLRALRPHHVRQIELPERGPWPCVAIYQDKTGEEVIMPLPDLAARIWQKYDGNLPVRVNSHRGRLIKELGQLAGLSRVFVDVSFSGKTRHEDVKPVWQAMSTHTARHTGAALLVWATEGDQTLKECALGHVSQSAYGYDSVERYGPRLLAAWETVFADRGQNIILPPVLSNNTAALRQ